MKERLDKFLKSKNAAKILFIVGIAAILLIFVSTVLGEDDSEKEVPTENTDFSPEEYCEKLEEDIRQMVQAICGDSTAVVTVTLETGMVYEYADEIKRNNAEDDTKTSEESEQTYITVKDSDGSEMPLIITSHMPQIRGVSVICSAGDEATVEKIKNAVTAALDISSRKIYIGRKSG